jgi:hypothetical protein
LADGPRRSTERGMTLRQKIALAITVAELVVTVVLVVVSC